MLKLIAALLMLLDHFAVIFLEPTSSAYVIARLIGRLAMPIFAYKIAIGFMYTRHFKQYLIKLGLMTLATQVPFTMMYYNTTFLEQFHQIGASIFLEHLNIGWTFLCSLLILYYIQPLLNHQGLSFFEIIILMLLVFFVQFGDYGLYGFLNVFIFYLFIRYQWTYVRCGLFLFGALVAYSFIFYGDFALSMINSQAPAIFSLFLIRSISDSKTFGGRYFFYYFYPLHMVVLLICQYLFF